MAILGSNNVNICNSEHNIQCLSMLDQQIITFNSKSKPLVKMFDKTHAMFRVSCYGGKQSWTMTLLSRLTMPSTIGSSRLGLPGGLTVNCAPNNGGNQTKSEYMGSIDDSLWKLVDSPRCVPGIVLLCFSNYLRFNQPNHGAVKGNLGVRQKQKGVIYSISDEFCWLNRHPTPAKQTWRKNYII